jgi:hypothetical protein
MKVELKFVRGQRVCFVSGNHTNGKTYTVISGVVESVDISKDGAAYYVAGQVVKEHLLFLSVAEIDSYLNKKDSDSICIHESVKNWIDGKSG